MTATLNIIRTAKHAATIPPIVDASLAKPALVFVVAAVSSVTVVVSWFNVPLVCSVLMGKEIEHTNHCYNYSHNYPQSEMNNQHLW